MAKKKKKTAKKKAPARAAKKKKKAPAKKASPKKKVPAKKPSSGSKSVDSVLKKYEKERASQQTQLATLQKKIQELEAKARAFQEQIAKLTDQENSTKNAISQLDSRRDEEISALLSKLGVQLGSGGIQETATPPAESYDEKDSSADEASDDNSDSNKDTESDSEPESDDDSEENAE